MNYTATLEEISASEIEIKGELSTEDFQKLWSQTVSTLGKETKISGFRTGQAPEKVIVNKIGEDKILLTMAENALQKLYPLIVVDKKIEAIGRPEISITKLAKNNPLGFTIKTAVLPTITLPDYKKIAAEVNKKIKSDVIEITEKEIDNFLENFKKMKPPAKEAETNNLPDDKLDTPEFRNKIKEQLHTDKERKEREKNQLLILDAIADETPIEIPEILIASELDKMFQELQSQIEQAGIKFDDYLSHLKKSPADLRLAWKDDAIKRVKIGLLLQKIITDAKLTVTAAELDQYIEKNLLPYLGKNIDREKITDYARNILLNQKVMTLLEKSRT